MPFDFAGKKNPYVYKNLHKISARGGKGLSSRVCKECNLFIVSGSTSPWWVWRLSTEF